MSNIYGGAWPWGTIGKPIPPWGVPLSQTGKQIVSLEKIVRALFLFRPQPSRVLKKNSVPLLFYSASLFLFKAFFGTIRRTSIR